MINLNHKHAALRILHLEDSPEDHQLVVRTFSQANQPVAVKRVDSLAEFDAALHESVFDVILADYRLPGFTALDAWALMNELHIRLPFVLLSGAIGETAAVQAIQAGISDYLPKEDLHKLRHVVQRALAAHAVIRAKEQADAELAQSEQQLAQFAEHLQTTIEQERCAIAREIHDDIGGSLAAIRFDLSWIERHTTQVELLVHVRAATDMLQHAVEASQRIMMNLRPALLDHGLGAALQWLAKNFSKRTSIETQVNIQLQQDKLPGPIELTVFRTAQESLTNIIKHTQCNLVKLDLTADSHFVTLEVADNGQGIKASGESRHGGFGIKGLQERAKTVGGWLDVSSAPGAGTTITLMIPLVESATKTGEAAS